MGQLCRPCFYFVISGFCSLLPVLHFFRLFSPAFGIILSFFTVSARFSFSDATRRKRFKNEGYGPVSSSDSAPPTQGPSSQRLHAFLTHQNVFIVFRSQLLNTLPTAASTSRGRAVITTPLGAVNVSTVSASVLAFRGASFANKASFSVSAQLDNTTTASSPRSSAPLLSVDTSSSCLRPPRSARHERSASSPASRPYPLTFSINVSPVTPEVCQEDIRRTNLSKLRRHLGASVPPDLIIDTVQELEDGDSEKYEYEDEDDMLVSAIEFAPPTPSVVERFGRLDQRAMSKPTPSQSVGTAPALSATAPFSATVSGKTSDAEAAPKRGSRLWVREKRGQRWVDDNYQGIVMELRMLR
ncbi:hypothetical protein K488DRAFT_85934 [Vararia minispora EC-137]|uniref:Uncharacterized protein n=1 Tax=Vararia minispora EC-137 TaxID=1314806 RepID=A0ACB8QLS8_9AGAM|nr:hypothetical protein K488DRAFT_85934 [Vararia minispora EC-137]